MRTTLLSTIRLDGFMFHRAIVLLVLPEIRANVNPAERPSPAASRVEGADVDAERESMGRLLRTLRREVALSRNARCALLGRALRLQELASFAAFRNALPQSAPLTQQSSAGFFQMSQDVPICPVLSLAMLLVLDYHCRAEKKSLLRTPPPTVIAVAFFPDR